MSEVRRVIDDEVQWSTHRVNADWLMSEVRRVIDDEAWRPISGNMYVVRS